eukprot:12759-Heterococcus_DN1.PRE.1
MDEIDDVVLEIVQQCASRGVVVSDVLAAFVARTVIDTAADSSTGSSAKTPLFTLDAPLTADGINTLIDRSVDRLLEIDSPSLETMRMQVAFDMSYLQEEKELERRAARRISRLKEMQRAIVTLRPHDSSDFETLTALHRQIFNYLLKHAAHDGAPEGDRSVEREVAAALESVFPRISLKAFIVLSSDEKHAQLEELASIVLGIRLFNRHIGKGGAAIPNVESEGSALLAQLTGVLSSESNDVSATCRRHQDAIVHTHLHQPTGVSPETLDRWKDELANRRQYLAYLQSIQEDVAVSERKLAALQERMSVETAELRQLVGNRASVPKEHVYPKFDEVARQWQLLHAEVKLVRARAATLDVLRQSRHAFTITLTDDLDIAKWSREAKAPPLDEEIEAAEAAVAVAERKDVGQSRMSATTAAAAATAATAYSDSKASEPSSIAHSSDAKSMPPTDSNSTERTDDSSDAAQAKHDDNNETATANGHSSSAGKSTDDNDAKADAKGDVRETVTGVTDTTADTTTAAAEAKQSSRRSSSANNSVQHSDSKGATDTAEQHTAVATNTMTRVNNDDVAIVDSPLLESDLPNQLSEMSVQVIETVVTHPDTATATDNFAHTKTTSSSTVAVEKPVHLSIESTPEFMQLPLEFQGFCPWTIVHRRGLLLAGRPELGVQRWRGAHYVFAHKVAAAAFQADPQGVVAGVLARVMKSPELIHLLRLQDAFPKASISRMLRGNGNDTTNGPKGVYLYTKQQTDGALCCVAYSLCMPMIHQQAGPGSSLRSTGAVEMRDAGTGTPTHFTEKHIDTEYSWNEWTLRRKALQ